MDKPFLHGNVPCSRETETRDVCPLPLSLPAPGPAVGAQSTALFALDMAAMMDSAHFGVCPAGSASVLFHTLPAP